MMDEFPGGATEIKRLKDNLGNWSTEEKRVLVIFGLTAFFLIFRQCFQNFIPQLDDTIIVMTAGMTLFLTPSTKKRGHLNQLERSINEQLYNFNCIILALFKEIGSLFILTFNPPSCCETI